MEEEKKEEVEDTKKDVVTIDFTNFLRNSKTKSQSVIETEREIFRKELLS